MQKYPLTMIKTEDRGRLVRRSLGEDGKTEDRRQGPIDSSAVLGMTLKMIPSTWFDRLTTGCSGQVMIIDE